ncbi:hypothetical protein B5F19_13355 [Pseudoflavonifractor sp. An184]|nr:hypothetical protein B5F19_13355 [Pseudoflavonifractor sp. An184]
MAAGRPAAPLPGGLAGGPGGHLLRRPGAGAHLSPRPSAGADGRGAPSGEGRAHARPLLTDI